MTTGKVAPDFHRNLGAWGSATRVRHIMPNVSHVSDRPRQFQRTVRLRLLISDSEFSLCSLNVRSAISFTTEYPANGSFDQPLTCRAYAHVCRSGASAVRGEATDKRIYGQASRLISIG